MQKKFDLNGGDSKLNFDSYFHFIKVLGMGSFGVVVCANDRETSQDCAIKVKESFPN